MSQINAWWSSAAKKKLVIKYLCVNKRCFVASDTRILPGLVSQPKPIAKGVL